MKNQFLVALHVCTQSQTLEEAEKILVPDGADGVLLVNNNFLISSSRDKRPNLFDLCSMVKDAFPSYTVGVNPLDLSTEGALHHMRKYDKLDVLWVDNGGIEEGKSYHLMPKTILEGIESMQAKYYGGVAFKYQQQPKNLERCTQLASQYFGAIITSGTKTGLEPDIEKIRLMHEYIGINGNKTPLGIASGMSPENVHLFLPYANIFIVASSLHKMTNGKNDFFRYDQDRIKLFREKISG